MKGLPRATDTSPPRDAWAVTVLGGIENLTRSLRKGDPYTAKSLNDLQQLRRRLDAFGAALDHRISLIERDENETP